MCKVVLQLLCFLYINEIKGKRRKPINLLLFYLFLIFNLLYLQSHISTHSSNIWIILHMIIHQINGFFFGLQSYVHEDSKAWIKLFAKAIKEPIMGGQFSTIFVLDTHKQIHVSQRILVFLYQGVLRRLIVNREINLFAKRGNIAQIISRRYVLIIFNQAFIYRFSCNDFCSLFVVTILFHYLMSFINKFIIINILSFLSKLTLLPQSGLMLIELFLYSLWHFLKQI